MFCAECASSAAWIEELELVELPSTAIDPGSPVALFESSVTVLARGLPNPQETQQVTFNRGSNPQIPKALTLAQLLRNEAPCAPAFAAISSS
jgi:hypothetical protein